MEISVKIKNLSVILGEKIEAINNVNLELPIGKTIGIIGPSGAGKTTLMRSIVGRLNIQSGNIEVLGLPAGSPKLREQITYMTQELSVYPDLTIGQNLKFFAIMAGQSGKTLKQTVSEVLSSVELKDKTDSLVRDLSGGQKQRVSLGIALIGSPKLMVLDEPTVGLDPVLRDKLWSLFKKLAGQGTTLIITSHSMDEARRCDDLVLIRGGKIIAHGSPQGLMNRTKTTTIEQSFLKLVGERE